MVEQIKSTLQLYRESKLKTVCLGCSASVASIKACQIIKGLLESNFNVIVVYTQNAKHFLTPDTDTDNLLFSKRE